jgi:hypothetical protein
MCCQTTSAGNVGCPESRTSQPTVQQSVQIAHLGQLPHQLLRQLPRQLPRQPLKVATIGELDISVVGANDTTQNYRNLQTLHIFNFSI